MSLVFSRFAVLHLLFVGCLAPLGAAVITIQPASEAESKDTKIYASVATSNFSSNLNIVSPDITDFRGLVQFDLSALLGVAAGDITSASIRLYATGLNLNNQSTSTSVVVQLLPILGNWRETAADTGAAPLATWDAFFGATPTLSVGTVAAAQTVTGVGFYDFDITALAKSWVDGSQANFGVMIQAPGPLGDVGIADVDSAGAGFGPALVVNTVPEPSAMALLGLMGAASLRRKRRL